MKKSLLLFVMTACILVSLSVNAEPQQLQVQYDDRYKDAAKSTVLKGSVSQSLSLPAGMYGMWQVHGTLMETTNYVKFRKRSSDVWVLRKDGDFVTLVNPQNGASATITVTEVVDNTATFVRSVTSGNLREAEQVTITLDGDTFHGTDLILSQEMLNGVTISDVAKYNVRGTKLSGQTIYKPRNAVTVGK